MTIQEGIALLTRIYKELPQDRRHRGSSFTLSLVCEKNTTRIEGETWFLSLDGWNFYTEEEWDEYITADDPREFIEDTDAQEGE